MITWLERRVERIYTEIFLEIKNVLKDAENNGKFWSKWVDNVWDENCLHAVNLNYVKGLIDINEYNFIVRGANNKCDTWKVYYFGDRPPECECGIFISSKIHFNMLNSFFKL